MRIVRGLAAGLAVAALCGVPAGAEEEPPPKARGTLNFVPAAQRNVNQHNLTQLYQLLLMYAMDEGGYPADLKAMVDAGFLADKAIAQCPTRQKNTEAWRFDYGLLPGARENDPPSRPLLWDKPGNFADGGMMVTMDGSVKVFKGMKEEEWARVHAGLMGRKDRAFLQEKLPGVNVDGFAD